VIEQSLSENLKQTGPDDETPCLKKHIQYRYRTANSISRGILEIEVRNSITMGEAVAYDIERVDDIPNGDMWVIFELG
jgi:hypothetical protein